MLRRSRWMLGVGVAAVACAALVTGVSKAGFKTSQAVVIVGTMANGDLGYVHGTSNTTENISCTTSTTGSGTTVSCFARNSTGTVLSCSSTAAPLVSAAQAINGDSYLLFATNGGGLCTRIDVRNGSTSRPKAF